MKKLLSFLFLLIIGMCSLILCVPQSNADAIDDLQKQINDLTSSLNQSKAATAPLESQLVAMQKQITDIKANIGAIEDDIAQKKKDIDEGYKTLEKQQQMLGHAIRNYYVKEYYNTPLLTFFSNSSAQEITQALAYQRARTDEDKLIITNLALSIQDLETKKKNLESEESRLLVIKTSLDAQSKKMDDIVQGAKAYQAKLSTQIAQLSAQQQSLIAAKQASLNIPQSAYSGQGRSCVDDRSVDPGFSPALAFFSYGVPNRVGLNQYGAWGRAKAGENVDQILQDYYPGLTLKKDYDSGATINVDGNGTMNIEDYTKRIYEVPNAWGDDGGQEALKAQAVAARSYGLAHKNGICTTESCQVFKPGGTKGGNWDAAVEATKGWVLVDGSGNPVSTQYSSTHGGFIINIPKFDGSGGNPGSFAELNERAYDKMSPWFYCDWGSRPAYNKTAWLKGEEVADIVNIIMLAKNDSSLGEHFYQTDNPPAGKDVWGPDRVRSELRSRGGNPFNSITGVSVNADFGSGKVTNITLSGDAGSQTFSGQEFKDWFNLRAPANVQIVGPLYNVEKR